ncbi:MAG TPA: hypothetical protein VF444_24350 [Pseudonocardiaceae bacterium]
MPLSHRRAASALSWRGLVVPDVGMLGHRVSAVVRVHDGVDRWRRENGWPPHADPSWFRTWFSPGPPDRSPLPAVDLVGILVSGTAIEHALNACGALISLAPCAAVFEETAAHDPWALNELDYYGVGAVVADENSARVVIPPEDRAGEFGPSLYGRWLREVLYDRVLRSAYQHPVDHRASSTAGTECAATDCPPAPPADH